MSRLKFYSLTCVAAASDLLLIFLFARLRMNFAASGFVHLLLVLVVAMKLGFWPATAVSIIANLGLNFFLIPPTLSLSVADPQNLMALIIFEICALIVSQLSAHLQHQYVLATAHRSQLEKLCSFSRKLLLLDRSSDPAVQILRLVQDEFSTRAALLVDIDTNFAELYSESAALTQARIEMKAAVKAALLRNLDFSNIDGNFFVRVMRIGSHPVGALGIEGTTLTPFLSTAISALCAIALERERSLDREALKSAEQRTEVLRGALLDNLAHEYKTPLTVIRAASGGLLGVGDLSPTHSKLIQLIDEQTCRLDSLTTRMMRTSSLDKSELNLHLELVDPEDLISTVIAQMHGILAGHVVSVVLGHQNARLHADRELLASALVQYLDNAAKYSDSESTITISAEANSSEVRMSVHNSGSYLPPSERELVFRRFHRSEVGNKNVPGNGVGLSVVSKVASVHGGRAWVTSDKNSGTTFFLAVPALKDINSHPSVDDDINRDG